MKVSDVMSRGVRCCRIDDDLANAAKIMWENDCGCAPVVDSERRALSVITDRDICMAGYMQRRPLFQIPVSNAASKSLFAVHPRDSAAAAEELMRAKQVRRVVVTDDGGRLVGILSLNDLARHTGKRGGDLDVEEVSRTLAAICRPSSFAAASPS